MSSVMRRLLNKIRRTKEPPKTEGESLPKTERESLPKTERESLEHYIKLEPERSDLRRRLCFVRLQQGEDVTEDDIARAFPDYVGAGEMYSFLAPLYLATQEKREAAHLDLPTRVLRDRFPDCPCCLHFRASWLLHFGNPGEARAILDEGRHLAEKHDYLMTLYANVLRQNGRDPEARAMIQGFFKTYTGNLWRAPDFLALQAEAVRRKLPPVLIVTLPKSGSVFLLNTLSRGLSIPSTYLCPMGLYADFAIEERVRDFAGGGAIAVDHPEADSRVLDALHRHDIRKIVFHYRDVRQSSLSFVHHHASDEMLLYGPRRTLLEYRQGIRADTGYFEDSYREMFATWLPFLERWADRIESDDRFEFLITSFEDLRNETEVVRRILGFYEIPYDAFDWSILDTPKEERAGHFRRGLDDEWRQVLSPELQAEIEETMAARPVLPKLARLARRN